MEHKHTDTRNHKHAIYIVDERRSLTCVVRVVAVHHDITPPYFTIALGGREKQTTRNRLIFFD